MSGPSRSCDLPDHLLPLGDGAEFAVWRISALRGSGFPFSLLTDLADEALAAEVDARQASHPDETAALAQRHTEALETASGRLRLAASRDEFLSAVVWQNPVLARSWLLRFVDGPEPVVRNKRYRQRETTVLSYLQRYAAKNDTIGFFGPVGWASWEPSVEGVEARYGQNLLAGRSVHLESWAIDEVATALAARDGLRELVPYHRVPAVGVHGSTAWRGTGSPVQLTELEALLLGLVDGCRSIAELVQEAMWTGGDLVGDRQGVLDALAALERRRLVRRELRLPMSGHPELTLDRLLASLPGKHAARARTDVQDLASLRDTVEAAPDAATLLDRIEAVHERFSAITGAEAGRLAGSHYVGRTILYTDARRAAEVRLGEPVLREIAPALEGLLLAARWFTARLGALTSAAARDSLRQLARTVGHQPVPFPQLLFALNPVILRDTAGVIERARVELVERFAQVTASGVEGGGILRLDPAAFLRDSRRVFGTARAPWAVAHYHSPDLMIAAEDAAAVAAGEYQVVLGELHAGMNTLQSPVFLNQCPWPGTLRRFAEHDPVPERVVPLFPKDWPRVTSRVYPPPVLVPQGARYVAVGSDLGTDDVEATAVGDLVVWEEGADLVVGTREGTFTRPLLEVVGEFLSMATATRFSLARDQALSPRVEVGKVVVTRRTWRFDGVPGFVTASTPAGRFLAARRWLRDAGLPRHAFARLPGEEKPWYVDFASPLLVENLARLLRRLPAPLQAHALELAEMLPDPGGLWLSDAGGQRYTSEFRIIAVDVAGHRASGEHA